MLGKAGAANYYNAVTQGGLDNTGATSVTSGIGTAITYYKANGYDGLYFPAGTYLLSTTLTVPAGTVMVGQSQGSTWLKGAVSYTNDNDTTSAMTIGNSGTTTIISSTTGDTFTDVTFIGGGGSYNSGTQPMNSHVITIGPSATSNITFTRCTIGPNSGTYGDGTTGAGGAGLHNDNVFVVRNAGVTVEDIEFHACHFLYCPRMMCELWDATYEEGLFTNISFYDCTFELAESEVIDYAGAAHSFVDNCTFRGQGSSNTALWDNHIVTEGGSTDITVTDNHFYMSEGAACGFTSGANTATGNHIDLSENPYSCTHDATSDFTVASDGNTITGNTINHINNPSSYWAYITGGSNMVNYNTYSNCTAPGVYNSGSGNTITPNTHV